MSTRTVAHYEIQKKLGEGGMGEVFLARDTRLDRQVALKFLSPHLSGDTNARQRLMREAKAASRISHPNIMTVHEVGEDDDGNVYIAMQYVAGDSLDRLIVRQELTVKRILKIVIQVCEGLQRAHASGIVHRDVKPQNILVDGDDHITILDFGLAKVFDGSKLTQTGATIGTMAYMSPEQIRGDLVDHHSDIFSFGAMLYEMITGRTPFVGNNPAETLHAIVYNTPVPPTQYNQECGENLESIVDKAMKKNPKDRYESVAVLLSDLRQELLLREFSSSDSIPVIRRHSGRDRRWKQIAWTGFSATLAILALLIVNPFQLPFFSKHDALAGKHSLAVMYFENIADPSDANKLAEMTTSLLITDLSESQFMGVLSRQRLYDIMRKLGAEETQTVDKTMATEIAREAGVNWVLTGSILKSEPQLVLVSTVADVHTGEILASQRIEGTEQDELFAVVDKLSAAIRADLKLPEDAKAEPDLPVAAVTTSSSDAYRHYTDGLDFADKLDYIAATNSFDQAIQFDSTFAMAHYHLARVLRARMMYAEAREAIAAAERHGQNLSRHDRLLIESLRALSDRHMLATIDALEKLIGEFPDEKDGFMLLAGIELGRRNFKRAVELYERMLKIDPLSKLAWNNLAYSYYYLGDHDRSIQAINKYINLAPDEPNPYDSRAELQAMSGRLDDAIASCREALVRQPDFAISLARLGSLAIFEEDYRLADSCYQAFFAKADREVRSEGRMYLSFIPLHRGQLRKALDLLTEGIAADRMEQVQGFYHLEKHIYKSAVLANLGDFDAALQTGSESLRIVRQTNSAYGYWARACYIRLLVQANRIEEARDSTESLLTILQRDDPSLLYYFWLSRGWIAQATDNLDSAVVFFIRSEDGNEMFAGRFALAECYLEQGQLGKAVETLQDLLKGYNYYRIASGLDANRAQYLLGVAYERSGWKAEAASQYRKFLQTWINADPELTEVADAQKRLALLQNDV